MKKSKNQNQSKSSDDDNVNQTSKYHGATKHVPCLLCAQSKDPQIGNIFDRPELINLIRKVLGISVSAISI